MRFFSSFVPFTAPYGVLVGEGPLKAYPVELGEWIISIGCVCMPYKSYAAACTLVDRCHFPPIFLAFVRGFLVFANTRVHTQTHTPRGFWSALKLYFSAHSLQFFLFFSSDSGT